MRALLQRVGPSSVVIGTRTAGCIDRGVLLFLGIEKGDGHPDMEYLVKKVAGLRIFEDEDGKMNLSVRDIGGAILVVSQFTLAADCRRGNRPSFDGAEAPDKAETIYNAFVRKLKETGIPVETGEFGAYMNVHLVNEGPVTLMIDSRRQGR